MKKKPTNVEAHLAYGGAKYSLSCELEGSRYHVWVDPETRDVIDTVLFKNPPLGVKHRDKENGWFSTRRLNAHSSFAAFLVGEMFAVAITEKLFEKAKQALADKEQREQEEADERKRQSLIREAAPELLEALRWAYTAINRATGPQQGPKGKDFGLNSAIETAIAKAEGKV